MKAITLWQPWASLVAAGDKLVETRSWSTTHRGLLAIHAASRSLTLARCLMLQPPFSMSTLSKHGCPTLPTGAVVAICELVQVMLITESQALPEEPERSFGDYSVGRYMWRLRDVWMLPKPIPATGRQGLWKWEPPAWQMIRILAQYASRGARSKSPLGR